MLQRIRDYFFHKQLSIIIKQQRRLMASFLDAKQAVADATTVLVEKQTQLAASFTAFQALQGGATPAQLDELVSDVNALASSIAATPSPLPLASAS